MTPTVIRNETLYTKCGWTPFDGVEVAGRVSRVVLRGQVAFADGKVVAGRGNGRLIR
jgi:dihydroorotase-like cyclic amidohydrolase